MRGKSMSAYEQLDWEAAPAGVLVGWQHKVGPLWSTQSQSAGEQALTIGPVAALAPHRLPRHLALGRSGQQWSSLGHFFLLGSAIEAK